MRIVYIDKNGEENYSEVYDRIVMDSAYEDGIMFLCYKDGNAERIKVPYSFEIITEEYYKS